MSEDVDVPGGYASMHQRRSESSGDGGRHVRWATVRVGAESGENDADRCASLCKGAVESPFFLRRTFCHE